MSKNQLREANADDDYDVEESEECDIMRIAENRLPHSVRALLEDDDDLPENILRFKGIEKMYKIDFCVYGDFECVISEGSEEHVPSGYALYLVSKHDHLEPQLFLYSGENVMEHFFADLAQISAHVNIILSENVPINMADEDWED